MPMAMAMVCTPGCILLPPFTSCCSLPPSRSSFLPRFHLCSSLRLRTTCRLGVGRVDPVSEPDSPNLASLSTDELKECLSKSLQGVNRGVFGVPLARKVKIEHLIELLEHRNPVLRPTANLEKVKGEWRLLYSTISILGSKRTKLGLRDFIILGDVIQSIDVDQNKATNTVAFSVAGFGSLRGALTIEASYNASSATRVDICFEKSSIVPDQLLKLFQKNYDVLLSIFNPEGWLEITYVDDKMRIGRDEKGNIFLLEKICRGNS